MLEFEEDYIKISQYNIDVTNNFYRYSFFSFNDLYVHPNI